MLPANLRAVHELVDSPISYWDCSSEVVEGVGFVETFVGPDRGLSFWMGKDFGFRVEKRVAPNP